MPASNAKKTAATNSVDFDFNMPSTSAAAAVAAAASFSSQPLTTIRKIATSRKATDKKASRPSASAIGSVTEVSVETKKKMLVLHCREGLADKERKFWATQEKNRDGNKENVPMEVDEEDATNEEDFSNDEDDNLPGPSTSMHSASGSVNFDVRAKLPVAVVIYSGSERLSHHDRITTVSKFVPQISVLCQEAHKAQSHGSMVIRRKYLGIPNKRFDKRDTQKYEDNSKAYVIQAAFEKLGTPGIWIVYFEGWTIPYEFTEAKLAAVAKGALEDGKLLAQFLAKLEEFGVKMAATHRYWDDKKKPGTLFFDYTDISYFHSMTNFEDGLASVKYMALTEKEVSPPKFGYTTVNIMDAEVYQKRLKEDANKSFEELSAKKMPKKTGNGGGCENPDGCVCDQRFKLLYSCRSGPRNMRTKANGLMDFSKFIRDRCRIAMECSDVCGCSTSCPRRHLQRGQQKALVVYYEGENKGFGLRANANFKAGEFIGEYTGVLKESKEGDDTSYEADCGVMDDTGLVVDSRLHGNCLRFMSHSCSPSAVFVTTYSRVYETDPLFPKIGVFAVKDIGIGEEVTICYYSVDAMSNAKSGVKCLCGTSQCYGWLPC